MSVEVRRYADLRPAEMEEWERLARKGRPPGEQRLGSDLRWAELDAETDYLVRVRRDHELVACAWVTRRTVTTAGHAIPVAGVRGVLTDPAQRRQGHGRTAMERAHELMLSFDDCGLAMLFSSVMAVRFYESLGWKAVPGPVYCDQPEGRINYTETLPTAPVMMLCLREGTDVPSDAIDVSGLPW